MKEKLPLLMTLISSLLAISMLANLYFYFSQSVPETILRQEVPVVNSKAVVRSFYEVGISGFQDGFTAEEACRYKNFKNQFCLHGYYFYKYRSDIVKRNSVNPKASAAEMVGLGHALAFHNIKPLDNPYNIEGWSFYKTLYDHDFASNLPDSCEALDIAQNRQKYCYWGAGSAAFFLDDNITKRLTLINQYTQNALTFISIATGSVQPKPIQNPEQSSIENLSLLYMQDINGSSKSKDTPKVKSCFLSKHLADCF